MLRCDDAVQKDAEGIFADCGFFAFAFGRGGQVEHDEKVLRPVEGKLHIAASAKGETFSSGLAGSQILFHCSGQSIESLGCYREQELVFTVEMPIGRVVRDASTTRDFPKSECPRADFANNGDGGVEKGLAKIDVVVGLGIDHMIF